MSVKSTAERRTTYGPGPVAPLTALVGLLLLLLGFPRLTWLAIGLSAFLLVVPRTSSGKTLLHPLVLFVIAFSAYNLASIYLADTVTLTTQLRFFVGALLAFVGGVAFVLSIENSRSDRGHLPTGPQMQARSLSVPTVACALAAVPGSLLMAYLLSSRGTPVLAADPGAARLSFFPNGLSSTIVVVSLQAALICSGVTLVQRRKGSRSGQKGLVGVSAWVTLLLYLTGNRGMLLIPVLVVVLFGLMQRTVWIRPLLVGAMVVLLGFSYLGYSRNLAAFGPTYKTALAEKGFTGPLAILGPALDYLQGTSATLDQTIRVFPAVVQHPHGAEFFGPLLHKPSADLYLKKQFGDTFVGLGLALGAINAFYLDFGFYGIISGFLLLGLVSALLYRRALSREGLWPLAYCLWLENLLLSLYGHPFAYLATLLMPLLTLGLARVQNGPSVSS